MYACPCLVAGNNFKLKTKGSCTFCKQTKSSHRKKQFVAQATICCTTSPDLQPSLYSKAFNFLPIYGQKRYFKAVQCL